MMYNFLFFKKKDHTVLDSSYHLKAVTS